jgi:uncharacterized membrane protein SirB2
MPLAYYYPIILRLHVGCVILSGSLFTARGIMRLFHLPQANHVVLRGVSYVIDTTLLSAAVLLTLILHQYPIVDDWLTAKVLWVALYIALGVVTLRQARTPWGQRAAFAAALLTFVFIVGIAVTHEPTGWLSWRARSR